MFSIDYGAGFLGTFLLALLVGLGFILAVWLYAATRSAKKIVRDADEHDAERPGADPTP